MSIRYTKKFRNHSAIAECHFDADENVVRQAIVEVASSLPNFSVYSGCFDDSAQLEVAFVTPGMKWLDILSIHLTEQRNDVRVVACFLYSPIEL